LLDRVGPKTLVGAALFQFVMTTVIDEGELEAFAHAPA
jgi:hypothetical protein